MLPVLAILLSANTTASASAKTRLDIVYNKWRLDSKFYPIHLIFFGR